MAGTKATVGKCSYCGGEFARAGMSRHLAACEKRRIAVAEADASPGERVPLIHLQLQDAWGGEYWLHLEMNGTAPLSQLDSYLRRIWLECCDHLSEFAAGKRYGPTVGMARKAAQVFAPGTVLTHTYDFGTSSHTTIKVVGVRQGRPTGKRPIALMARNAAPDIVCQECGAPAEFLCNECMYDEDRSGALCARHAKEHPHEDYGLVDVVNSPRMGMCGYSGPAEPPY